MVSAEDVGGVALTFSALLMVWFILRQRMKNRIRAAEPEMEYSGSAKNPETLIEPTDAALRELDRLLGESE